MVKDIHIFAKLHAPTCKEPDEILAISNWLSSITLLCRYYMTHEMMLYDQQ